MAHELTPKADNPPLPVDEIIRRLGDSFAHLQVDVEHASRKLEESARYMAGAGGPHFSKEDIDRTRRLVGYAAYVIIADDPDTDLVYLSFLLEPEHERIFIDYESGVHEERSHELRERLARTLDYNVELV
jgi:hypothetical protein